MKFITCKAQWFSRPMTTKTSMDGFEGPAKTTEVDDGFGNVMVRGQRTSAYNCYFEQTGEVNHNPIYDGTIRIPDCKFNREKIAAHVRGRDFRVVDRNLEREILAECPPGARARQEKARAEFQDMPDDFDGSSVVLRREVAVVDSDPIEDPHAAVADAVFTDVKAESEAPAPVAETAEVKDVPEARRLSISEMRAGAEAPVQATEAPKGIDPRAAKVSVKKPVDLVPDQE